MTIETTQHPYRALAGAAFVTLTEDVQAMVNDDRWEPVLGRSLILPGGCELDLDDGELEQALEDIEQCEDDLEEAATIRPDLVTPGIPRLIEGAPPLGLLVPLIVNDADLPPVRLLVPAEILRGGRMQRIERGTGAHARGGERDAAETECRHDAKDFGRTRCRGCLRRFWTARAREMGVIDG